MAALQLYQNGDILACLACNKYSKYPAMRQSTPVKLLYFGQPQISTPEAMGEKVLAWMEAAVPYDMVKEEDFLPDGYTLEDWDVFLADAAMVRIMANGGQWSLTPTLNFTVDARGPTRFSGFRAFSTRSYFPDIKLTDPARDELGEVLWALFAYADHVMQGHRIPYRNPNPGSFPGEMAPAVLAQLDRLGITVNPPPDDPEEVIEFASDRAVALPESLRRLMYDVDWPTDLAFARDEKLGTYTFEWYTMDDVEPWMLMIVMYYSNQYYVSMRLDCADPSDPQVFEIDHDDPDIEGTFGPVDGPEANGGLKLSEFLSCLAPVIEKDKS